MIKAMLFIDGSWLYANLPELGKVYGKPDFQVDFGKLPTVLAEDVAEQAGMGAIDLVRTYYFASYAENYDVRDVAAVQRRMAFFSRLREDYNYEVEAFPINYQGRRLRRVDRDPADEFVPKEKCVDISLAITVMHYAMLPGAMDVAILLVGDRDFVPLLCDIRRRGVRVAVASIYGSCAQELADPADSARVRDFDVVWLNDLLDKVEYLGDEQAAGGQQGGGSTRRVWTTNVPRWGRRPAWLRHRDALLRVGPNGYVPEADAGQPAAAGEVLRGRIKNVIWDRGFGFIAADDGPDYFFHANALGDGLTFDELQPDMDVAFEVKTPPTALRAGAALVVRRCTGAVAAADPGSEGDEAADDDEEAAATAPSCAEDEEEADAAFAGAAAGGRPAVARAAAEPVRACGGGGALLCGRIKNVIWDRGFGFIASDDGPDYFFHANALTGDLTFETLQPGLAVAFEVKARPTAVRAGAALGVRRAAAWAADAADDPAAAGGRAPAEEPPPPTPAEEDDAPEVTARAAAVRGAATPGPLVGMESGPEGGEDGRSGGARASPEAAETLDSSTIDAASGRLG